jgi:hypothetical protein
MQSVTFSEDIITYSTTGTILFFTDNTENIMQQRFIVTI